VDVLTDLLGRARATGSVFALSTLHSPWGLELDDDLPLCAHVALEGPTWVCVEAHTPVALEPGDLALVAAGRPHRLVSDPGAPCRSLSLTEARRHLVAGTRSTFVVPGPGAPSRILCGAYRFHGDLCDPLLAVVPPLLVARGGDVPALGTLVEVMVHETGGDGAGRSVILDRLLDIVFVHALRHWLNGAGPDTPAWYRALGDPDVARALAVVHADPGRRWTVASWAREAGMSRATLARRFRAMVGVGPMTYVTTWRMRLAAEQLRDGRRPVAHIGRDLGYDSDAAFTVAFRRHHGVSPHAYRAAG
jgi:AraC-like DNA-binding protein